MTEPDKIKINRRGVDSSAILSVGYSDAHRILEVEFTNGYVHRYLEVPAGEYDLMLKADSIGRYFNCFVKGKYEAQAVSYQGNPISPRG